MHVLVVGGGVMGCGVARELARAGAAVTVLEKALPGAEASSAAAGILGAQSECEGPGPFLDLCLHARALWPGFARDLQADSGVDVGYLGHGLLEIAFQDADLQHAQARAGWMRERGLRAEVLDPAAARALEPALADTIAGALHLPDDHQVEPPLLVRALAIAAARAGVIFRSGSTLDAIEVRGGAVRAVRVGGERLQADAVVLATGAWTDLLPELPVRRTRIRPVHGQLVMLDTRPPILRRTVAGPRTDTGGGYVVPRADGRVVVGATTEQTGFHKQVTAGGLRCVLGLALDLVPALAQAPVLQHWSGLRPHAEDGRPLLGPHPEVPNLHFATGHHRNGILLAPATAELVAAAVLGRPPGLDLASFRP